MNISICEHNNNYLVCLDCSQPFINGCELIDKNTIRKIVSHIVKLCPESAKIVVKDNCISLQFLGLPDRIDPLLKDICLYCKDNHFECADDHTEQYWQTDNRDDLVYRAPSRNDILESTRDDITYRMPQTHDALLESASVKKHKKTASLTSRIESMPNGAYISVDLTPNSRAKIIPLLHRLSNYSNNIRVINPLELRITILNTSMPISKLIQKNYINSSKIYTGTVAYVQFSLGEIKLILESSDISQRHAYWLGRGLIDADFNYQPYIIVAYCDADIYSQHEGEIKNLFEAIADADISASHENFQRKSGALI